jgi:hypothetical protein
MAAKGANTPRKTLPVQRKMEKTQEERTHEVRKNVLGKASATSVVTIK